MSKIRDYINSQYDINEAYLTCFNQRLPISKCYCPNPEHHNVDTPAAKAYPPDGIYCFVCMKRFTSYDLFKWYRPDIIDEINSTVILPNMEIKMKDDTRIIRCTSFDRSWSMEHILHEITNIDL